MCKISNIMMAYLRVPNLNNYTYKFTKTEKDLRIKDVLL